MTDLFRARYARVTRVIATVCDSNIALSACKSSVANTAVAVNFINTNSCKKYRNFLIDKKKERNRAVKNDPTDKEQIIWVVEITFTISILFVNFDEAISLRNAMKQHRLKEEGRLGWVTPMRVL